MKVRSTGLVFLFGLAALFYTTPAFSHHSNVGFEVTKVITVAGVVKGFRWANPRIRWVYLTVDDEEGRESGGGRCEGRAPGVLASCRLDFPKSVMVGDKITIDMSPAKDGSLISLIARVTKADGTILPNAPPQE